MRNSNIIKSGIESGTGYGTEDPLRAEPVLLQAAHVLAGRPRQSRWREICDVPVGRPYHCKRGKMIKLRTETNGTLNCKWPLK